MARKRLVEHEHHYISLITRETDMPFVWSEEKQRPVIPSSKAVCYCEICRLVITPKEYVAWLEERGEL